MQRVFRPRQVGLSLSMAIERLSLPRLRADQKRLLRMLAEQQSGEENGLPEMERERLVDQLKRRIETVSLQIRELENS